MSNEMLRKIYSRHGEELSHYASRWDDTRHVLEDSFQKWRDESALSFTRLQVSQIEESAGLMKSLFHGHNISLLQILTFFKEVEQVHKQLRSHLDTCTELSSVGSSLVVKGNDFDSEANEETDLAMEQIEKALSIIKEIKK